MLKKKKENFFENLTLVPIDKELIDKSTFLILMKLIGLTNIIKEYLIILKIYEQGELQKSCSAI